MKEILVLGGTGAMGANLVEMGGVKWVVTSRRKHNNSGNVEYVLGNAGDDSFLFPLLKSRRWAAVVDFMAYSTTEFAKRMPVLLANTDQLVFLSSSRVYADSKTALVEDSSRLLDVCNDAEYLSTDEYALSKAREEDMLRASGQNNWTIVRPYITFSEYRLQLGTLEKEDWLYRALHGRTIVFSRDVASRLTTLTYGGDVARGIYSLLGKAEALGQTFHITTKQHQSWQELLDNYLDSIETATGRRPKVMMTDEWKPYSGGGKWQVCYDRLYDRTFDNDNISRFIDTTKFRETKQALTDCVASFISNPHFRDINWESEAKKDILTGEWTPLSEIHPLKQKIKYVLVRLRLYHR